MEAKERIDIGKAIEMIEKCSTAVPLNKDLVESGCVLKAPIYEDSNCNISLLMLSPKAKIKKYQHIDDKECYFIIKEKNAKVCLKGGWHELENPSDEEWMPVLSLKYRE